MAGITANRPMGRIRSKNEVSGLEKPKKKGSKPNGPTWPMSPWKGRGMAGIGTQWAIRAKALVWTMIIPRRDKNGNAIPKA